MHIIGEDQMFRKENFVKKYDDRTKVLFVLTEQGLCGQKLRDGHGLRERKKSG